MLDYVRGGKKKKNRERYPLPLAKTPAELHGQGRAVLPQHRRSEGEGPVTPAE